ncbi:hypothetical protein HN587_06460 [Candidatus Woesearchaeota archaeon]|jgi:hypothetical protein|nr:hypothetical protein [Candidatus Woesearchaeota archaeon]
MFLKNKKAQVALFILIGVVMVGIYGFMNYLTTSVNTAQLDQSVEKVQTELFQSGAIPVYVEFCLDKTAQEAIILAGLQGGDIFTNQEGPMLIPQKSLQIPAPLQTFPSTKVKYGILRPKLNNNSNYPEPPGYPGHNQVPALNFSTWGNFGSNSLRKLCDINGTNKPLAILGYFNPLCYHNLYTDFWSTQEQIEYFVSKRMQSCVNWTAIKNETGINVTVTGLPETTMTLGVTNVYMNITYPLEIETIGSGTQFTRASFGTKIPVRFKRIVEFATLLNSMDSIYLSFNYSNYNFVSMWDEYIDIKLFTPFEKIGGFDEVVQITDTKSSIGGKPFIYRFVRENRYPVLDYIKYTKQEKYDIITMEYRNLTISPNPDCVGCIYDPDEDKLTYDFTGWKETCSEKFNFNTGESNLSCSLNQPQSLNTNKNPGNWTGSIDYNLTLQNATIYLEHEDIGPHNITVYVCDDAGLCDYQIVRVMVFDVPQMFIKGANKYGDIPDEYASIEDPYEIKGTTIQYFTDIVTIIFNDAIENFEISLPGEKDKFDYKLDVPWENYDINTIVDKFFKRENLDGINLTHNITMTVTPSLPPKVMLPVNVFQCLPHRNEKHPFPYPYHNYTLNSDGSLGEEEIEPFQAGHACCSLGDEQIVIANLSEMFDQGEYLIKHEFGTNVKFSLVSMDFPAAAIFYAPAVDGTMAGICGADDCLSFNLTVPGILNITVDKTANFFSLINQDEILIKFILTSTDSNYPEYGSYLDESKICFEGAAQYSAVGLFDDVGQTVTYFDEVGGLICKFGGNNFICTDQQLSAMSNDIIRREFLHFCSGDVNSGMLGIEPRGNICGGLKSEKYYIHDNCEDKKLGEDESCEGPAPPKTSWPKLNAANCHPYSYDSGKTYEYTFNMTLADGSPPDGICNNQMTCSSSNTEFNASETEGKYILFGAVCKNGECNDPLPAELGSVDCNNFNGLADQDLAAQNYYCEYATPAKTNLSSKFWNCSENPDAACAGVKANPDISSNMCDACSSKQNSPKIQNVGSTWQGDKCCGDDLGEGGFPYFHSGNAAKRAGSTQLFAGAFMGEVCDDYYSNDPSKGIDNNCDGKVNCEANECGGKIGPNKKYCCTTNNHCNMKIDPHFEKASCGEDPILQTDDGECVCSDLNSDKKVFLTSALLDGGFEFCSPILGYNSKHRILVVHDSLSDEIDVEIGIEFYKDNFVTEFEECEISLDLPVNACSENKLDESIKQATCNFEQNQEIIISNSGDECFAKLSKK